jgi:hypothetical protein
VKTTDLPAWEWKLLGKLDIAFSTDAESTLSDWLEKVLKPLDLRTEFERRVINSAHETIAHATPPNGMLLEEDHLHLLIFVTEDYASKGRTWGFFHIEKTDGAANECNPHDHSIEFYLYLESQ